MKTVITQGKKGQEKETLQAEWAGSAKLRERLVEVLTARIEENRKQQCSMEDFNCMNWQYKQAAYISKEKTLQDIIDLLK
jgi:hypothetical protein